MTTPIPSPPAVPFLGHINTLDKDLPIKSINLLAQQYGEIFQLNVFGQSLKYLTAVAAYRISFGCSGEKKVYISSYELVNEVSDDKRFPKKVTAGLNEVRHGTGDGLFTVSSIYAHFPRTDDVDYATYRRLGDRRNTTGALPVRSHPCPDTTTTI